MITKLKPYPAYKDSSVEWLDKVPEHWEVRRLRASVTGCINGMWGNEPNGIDDIICVRVADFDRTRLRVRMDQPTLRAIKANDRHPRLLKPGDLLLEKSGGGDLHPVGVVVLYDHSKSAVCSNFIARMPVAKSFNSVYLTYLHSQLYKIRLNVRSIKQTTGIQNLDSSQYLNEKVVFPPLSEQNTIVRFLDYVDRRVRRVICLRQKRIKLLEEYKQAVIHQAVTGQIDVQTGKPYPAYKDSGVEWLGKVPEHWEVVPLKRLAWFKSGAGFPVQHQGDRSAEIPFFKVSDMNTPGNEKYLCVSANMVSMTIAQCLGATLFPAGTIVFPKVGGALLTNKRRIAAHRCCIDNNVMACVVRECNRDFLFLIMSHIDLGEIAKPGPVPAISEGEVREIRVALPSAPEQTAIVEYLDNKTAAIERAIAATRREIELLKEFRTSLIADVVTGKVDVREFAERLPEEPSKEAEPLDEEEKGEEDIFTGETDMETVDEEGES